MDLGNFAFITIVIQLIFLEGILSIDNAAVLGAMVAPLPNNQPVPWPRALNWLSAPVTRIFGMQRDAALKVGLLGAYVGRGAMLFAAAFVANNLWIRAIGALYLIYLAVAHISQLSSHDVVDHELEQTPQTRTGFWSTVLAIELADLAFSIDNVVAAIALSDQLWVVMLGVALGIVTMRFAAGIFSRMISWEPALQVGAYLLVFAIGLELLLEEFFHIGFAEDFKEFAQFGVSAAILVGTVAVARTPFLRGMNFVWSPIIWLFRILRAPFDLLFLPFRLLGRLFRRSQPAEISH